MNDQPHVYVAMSGGVDSAVAAALLLEEGYRVSGVYMDTWKDPKFEAEAGEDLGTSAELAKHVAETLGIPFEIVDVRDRFYADVVRAFIRKYLSGQTPNPCLFCNPQVKWGILQAHALAQGADLFATGHYAQLVRSESGKVSLLRGVDRSKDQSYVLSMLTQTQLQHSLLPLGGMTKDEVRKAAEGLRLLVADRQDSQDLCFLGHIDYRDFLERFAPDSNEPGEIVNLEGEVLGQHEGLAFYTVGQRKGIRVAAAEPYYVVDKDMTQNRLIVGFADQVGRSGLTAAQPNWIAGEQPDVGETYDVMIRYRAKPVPAVLSAVSEAQFRLEFDQAVGGITPGQVAVLYRDEKCLGGGVIQSSH